jgi:Domain of unknown function (DUF1841)
MYTDNRNAYRQLFFDVWQKHQKQISLEPIEKQVLEVILTHPEYHPMLSQPGQFMSQEFAIEENPFFHMSLHIAVREQLQMNRPAGIREAYQQLKTRFETEMDVEHFMITVLANIMHQSQMTGTPPDEQEYLQQLKAQE